MRPVRVPAVIAVGVLSLLPLGATATAASPSLASTVAIPAMPGGCGDLDLSSQKDVQERAADAEQVFLGRVDSISRNGAAGDGASQDESTGSEPEGRVHHVLVKVPLAGDAPKGNFVTVEFMPSARADDPKLRVGGNYLFFTRGTPPAFGADACDGFAPAGKLDDAALARISGWLVPEPEPEPLDVNLRDPEDGAPGSPELGRLVAPGGAIGLLGVLGLVLINRLGRQRR